MNYIPHTEKEIKEMLKAIGASSIDDLFSDIPSEAITKHTLDIPDSMTEMELKKYCSDLASENTLFKTSFLGAGSYRHFIPSAVRAVISRAEFYTAYTPYQAEASQGTLQAIYEFQSFICLLTGMDVANASLYDGSTSVAEAAILALAETRRKKVLVSKALHPEYRQVLSTYLKTGSNIDIAEVPIKDGRTDPDALKDMIDRDTAAVIIQNPNFFGSIEATDRIPEIIKQAGALFIVTVTEPISLGILKAPGAYGADIVVGECQSLGIPMNFGGPSLGFIATSSKYMRKIPGRLCGKTVDKDGKTGYVLTLQAREQHIRREKASSNICTNGALCALAATVYLSMMGKKGFYQIASQNAKKTKYAIDKICSNSSFKRKFHSYVFNEFVVECSEKPKEINKRLKTKGILGGLALGSFYPELSDCLLLCVTEMNTKQDIDLLADVMSRKELISMK